MFEQPALSALNVGLRRVKIIKKNLFLEINVRGVNYLFLNISSRNGTFVYLNRGVWC